MQKILRLLFILFLPVFCHAQKMWTLQECVDYSLKNNILNKQARLNAELSKSRLQQSYASMLPTLNGSISNNYSYGRTIDPFTNVFVNNKTQSNSFSLNSNVILFEGFQLQNTRRQNDYDYLASKKDAEKSENDVILNVVTFYMQVLFNDENLKIAESLLSATDEQLARTKNLVAAGALPRGNQLDMESQRASDELRLVNAQNQLAISYLDLEQAMDLDSTAGFKIDKPDLSKFQYTILEMRPSDIFTVAVMTQPDIKSTEYKLQSARAGLSAARGMRSPRLVLSGSYGTGYSDARQRVTGFSNPDSALFGFISNNPVYYTPLQGAPIYEKTPFNSQLKDNLNQFIGLSLSIPIYNNWQAKGNIDRARINFENAELNRQLTRNRLLKTIQQAHADAAAALRKFNASVSSLNATKESYAYAEQKYNLGVMNSLDFLIAKNNLAKADSDLLQAKYEYVFKSKILDFYLGKPLAF